MIRSPGTIIYAETDYSKVDGLYPCSLGLVLQSITGNNIGQSRRTKDRHTLQPTYLRYDVRSLAGARRFLLILLIFLVGKDAEHLPPKRRARPVNACCRI